MSVSWNCQVMCHGCITSSHCHHLTKPKQFDICKYISTTGDNFPNSKSDFCFNHFKGSDDFDNIKRYITDCCHKSGFKITTGSNSKRKAISSNRDAIIDFQCYYCQSKTKKSVDHHPDPNNKDFSCNFCFKVFCDAFDKKWYLFCDTDMKEPSLHLGHHYVKPETIEPTIEKWMKTSKNLV